MPGYGVPHQIITDFGLQFRSRLFTDLNRMLGTQIIHSTAPTDQGLHDCPLQELPWVCLGLRDEDGVSSAERIFGVPLTLPGTPLDVPEVNMNDLAKAN